jgi:hypothetical protein
MRISAGGAPKLMLGFGGGGGAPQSGSDGPLSEIGRRKDAEVGLSCAGWVVAAVEEEGEGVT